MNIKVSVTKKDIRNGSQGDPRACPVALALNRSLKPLNPLAQVNVYPLESELAFEDGQPIALFAVPKEVDHFINSFDCIKDGLPFDFKVVIPAKSLRAKKNRKK